MSRTGARKQKFGRFSPAVSPRSSLRVSSAAARLAHSSETVTRPQLVGQTRESRHLYGKLLEDAEAAEDLAEYRAAKVADDGFRIPHEIVAREVAGESSVKLWREHRCLTQEALANGAGISKPYLSQIEAGKNGGVQWLSSRR
ncbi:MAG: helix-turn-helix domain-containing protein [Deltaproteobacteria bacterium]|nr:helix-turn-helix domain-containing protein [Deltaproteobacteria bacterium]